MASPEAVLGNRPALGERAEQAAEHGGQTAAGLVVGFARAVYAPQMRDMGAGGIAVQNLQHKQVNGGDWIEESFAQDLADSATNVLNKIGFQQVRNI